MVARGTAHRLMTSVSAALLLTLTAVVASGQLMPRTQPPGPEKLPDFERAVQAWLTSELSLQGVEVAATRSDLSIGFELATQDREEIMSQITLVALHAAAGAPWVNNLRISPSIAGYPVAVTTVPVDAVRRLANGQLNDEGFYRTWQTELMPLMGDCHADLLASLATNQGWMPGAVSTTDGLSALLQFGLPEAFERFPENHAATVTTVQTGGGQLQVAVIDAGDEANGAALLEAIAIALGGTAPPQPDAMLNVPGTPPVKVRHDGGLLYIASGAESDATLAIATLLNPPADPTMIADAGTPAGGGGTATTSGDPAGGGATTTTGQPPAGGDAPAVNAEPDVKPYEPMALLRNAAVKQATICLGFDDRSGLRGVEDAFPSGTEKVALYLEIKGARPNSEVELTWQRDGKIIGRQILIVSGDQKNMSYLYAKNQPSLWNGSYAVDIEENDTLVGRMTFSIGEQ